MELNINEEELTLLLEKLVFYEHGDESKLYAKALACFLENYPNRYNGVNFQDIKCDVGDGVFIVVPVTVPAEEVLATVINLNKCIEKIDGFYILHEERF